MFTELLFRMVASSSAAVVCPGTTTASCSTGLPKITAGTNELQTVLQLVFGILAALAVMFVVIGGLRFVFSEGKPENISNARETIIYALVGLVVALLAEGIVTFVLGKT